MGFVFRNIILSGLVENRADAVKEVSKAKLLQSHKEEKRDLSKIFGTSNVREGNESTFYDSTLEEVWGDPLQVK